MTAGIARVLELLELHEPATDLDGVWCVECRHAFPCPTVAVLVEEAAS